MVQASVLLCHIHNRPPLGHTVWTVSLFLEAGNSQDPKKEKFIGAEEVVSVGVCVVSGSNDVSDSGAAYVSSECCAGNVYSGCEDAGATAKLLKLIGNTHFVLSRNTKQNEQSSESACQRSIPFMFSEQQQHQYSTSEPGHKICSLA